MKVTVKQTTVSEIWRIIYTINSIVKTPSVLNYYPALPDSLLVDQCIVLPKLHVYSVPGLWKLVSQYEFDSSPDEQMKLTAKEIFNQSDKNAIKNKLLTAKVKKSYASKIRKYICELQKFLRNTFDLSLDGVDKIRIRLTTYGTPSSYTREGKVLYITYRIDTSLDSIGEVYLLQLLDADFGRKKFESEEKYFQSKIWEQEKAVVKYILSRGKFGSRVEEEKNKLVFGKQEHEKQVLQQSQKHLAELGIMTHSNFVVKDEKVHFKGSVVRGLTPDAMKVFSYLVQNRGEYCKLCDLNRHIWGEKTSQKFSLHYVPKLIYQTRMTIKSLGIRQDLIETKRKMGYVFSEI